MLRGPSMRAIAVEMREDRAARIRHNAVLLGVPDLTVVQGTAPAALEPLPRPDAVFVGGGASDRGVLDTAMAALRPGGRLVVNAVTVEGEAELLARRAAFAGELLRIAISRVEAIGGMSAWRPARAVTQWAWVKQ